MAAVQKDPAVGMLLMKWLLGPSEVRGPVAIARTQR